MDSYTALFYVNIVIWCALGFYLSFLAYNQSQITKKINNLNMLKGKE